MILLVIGCTKPTIVSMLCGFNIVGYHESLEPSCRAGVRSFAEGSSFGTAEAEERRMTRGTDADGVAETEAVAARCSERLPQRPKLDAIAVRVTFVCGVTSNACDRNY